MHAAFVSREPVGVIFSATLNHLVNQYIPWFAEVDLGGNLSSVQIAVCVSPGKETEATQGVLGKCLTTPLHLQTLSSSF